MYILLTLLRFGRELILMTTKVVGMFKHGFDLRSEYFFFVLYVLTGNKSNACQSPLNAYCPVDSWFFIIIIIILKSISTNGSSLSLKKLRGKTNTLKCLFGRTLSSLKSLFEMATF